MQMPVTSRGLTLRVVVLGLILLALGNIWVRYASLITFGANIDNSVPPGPALAALLVVLVANRGLEALSRKLALRHAEVLVLYGILLVGMPMTSLGIVRYFLPSITALRYFATPENEFAKYADLLPGWVAPQDRVVVEHYYEGSPTGAVPWEHWFVPLLAWTLLFGAFFVALLCVASLMRRQWVESDKLTFPLVTFNLEVAGVEKTDGGMSFFRNPLMWVGFGISSIYNLTNFANALNPGIKALGLMYNLGGLLTESPWNAMSPLYFYHRPEFVGLGYFVPLEILFTIWAGYWVLKLEQLGARLIGWEVPGFPFEMRQSLGGYLGMTLVLLYMGRHQLRALWNMTAAQARDEAIPPRLALAGAAVGLGVVVAWCVAAGMVPLMALAYIVPLTMIALTFSRARGETGIPTNWAFPWAETKEAIVDLPGSAFWSRGDQFRPLTILSTMHFLSRGYFPEIIAYQLENLEMARRGGVRMREMVGGMLIGCAAGLVAAYVMHLQAFYTYGANVLEGGTTAGGYRTQEAVIEFGSLAGMGRSPVPPNPTANLFGLLGGMVTVGLAALRFRYLRFPIHPLGVCLATSYGYLMWAPFLTVWIAKVLVVRLGGAGLYRRLGPLFLGLAFGHFFMAGMVWGAFSNFLPHELFRRLHIDIG